MMSMMLTRKEFCRASGMKMNDEYDADKDII